jgi:hypothetical protein
MGSFVPNPWDCVHSETVYVQQRTNLWDGNMSYSTGRRIWRPFMYLIKGQECGVAIQLNLVPKWRFACLCTGAATLLFCPLCYRAGVHHSSVVWPLFYRGSSQPHSAGASWDGANLAYVPTIPSFTYRHQRDLTLYQLIHNRKITKWATVICPTELVCPLQSAMGYAQVSDISDERLTLISRHKGKLCKQTASSAYCSRYSPQKLPWNLPDHAASRHSTFPAMGTRDVVLLTRCLYLPQ